MPSKKAAIKVYVSDDEYSRILASADKAGLSLSTFARRVCLGQDIKSKVDSRAVMDMLKVNADLGRLGGLLKLWLTQESGRQSREVRLLLNELTKAKNELLRVIARV